MKIERQPGQTPVIPKNRSFDGSGNNLKNQDWNKAGSEFPRQSPSAYEDRFDSPSGADRPNPREISNAVLNERGRAQDPQKRSNMVWAWGQFLDHDITATPNPGRPDWNIQVPAGDRYFDPQGKGEALIPFSRSSAAVGTGLGSDRPREQQNNISGWIDASMVYGSSQARADALRAFEGGRLKTSGDGDMLPHNTMGLVNDNPMRKPETSLMAAGDGRANENLGLLSLHTVFLREHNRLVAELSASDPSLDDEALYQTARKIVGGMVQNVTFQEFLPSLLGEGAVKSYDGYKADVDPRVSNEFSTAAYRMGHSQIEPIIWREGADGKAIPERDVPLLHAYFSPEKLAEGGIEPLLRGLTSFIQEPTDEGISTVVRNMLFGRPGKGGMDLASINIQRGRDHGLPDLNTLRESFGLKPFSSFEELTGDPILADKLKSVYPKIENVDPWVGMLCEPPVENSAVGESLQTILTDQFQRLRDGDRFWFENDPSLSSWQDEIRSTSLSDIIRRNTDIDQEMDDTPFFGHKSNRRGEMSKT